MCYSNSPFRKKRKQSEEIVEDKGHLSAKKCQRRKNNREGKGKPKAENKSYENNQNLPYIKDFKQEIIRLLQTSTKPLSPKQISKHLTKTTEFVFIWLASTGKLIPEIVKLGPNKYIYKEKAEEIKGSATKRLKNSHNQPSQKPTDKLPTDKLPTDKTITTQIASKKKKTRTNKSKHSKSIKAKNPENNKDKKGSAKQKN